MLNSALSEIISPRFCIRTLKDWKRHPLRGERKRPRKEFRITKTFKSSSNKEKTNGSTAPTNHELRLTCSQEVPPFSSQLSSDLVDQIARHRKEKEGSKSQRIAKPRSEVGNEYKDEKKSTHTSFHLAGSARVAGVSKMER